MRRHLIVALAAAFLAACATAPAPVPPAPAAATPPPPPPALEPEPEPAPEPVCRRISIAATGDIMPGTDFPDNRLPDDDGVSFLQHVTPVLAAADVAIGNLEGVLVDGGEPFKKCQNPSACYLFRSPERYAAHLAAAGFDVMSLANNHARDFGEDGRDATMAALQRHGIRHSGRIGDVARFRQRGMDIAYIAFSTTGGSHSILDVDEAAALVAELAATHDLVLTSFHGGAEGADATRVPFTMETYYGEQRGDVVKFAHAVIDAGADLVIGHGPHVPRALELYRGRLIAYSLGNFATYYGISVAGDKGVAPLLTAVLDQDGALVHGRVDSFVQVRPGGPRPDPRQRALAMIRELTAADFGGGGLAIGADGRIAPAGGQAPPCPADDGDDAG